MTVHTQTEVLVIGGGPGGSYAATLLARNGFKVTLLERDIFPRYHIGESLLPSARQYLSIIGAEDLIDRHGFAHKPGAAVKLNHSAREAYTDFTLGNTQRGSWNVVRSEFDHLLLKHAAESGVHVYEGVKVTEIEFHPEHDNRPVAAIWESKSASSGRINFDWLVDASGRRGVMSTQHLHNRIFTESLRNVAFWGYWAGGKRYMPGSPRENAPWFEALADETGWVWYIPLHNETVSVGFVLREQASVSKRRALNKAQPGSTMQDFYLSQLEHAPHLRELLSDATLQSGVKTASDYSYSATTYAGDHFRLVGDAAAFIDPFFSSGVHLAMTGALSAACTIAASRNGSCSEERASAFHSRKVGAAYTRFLVVVLGIYKQITSQSKPVLQDVNEEDFDRAFTLLRPIIQGSSDAGQVLTEDEIQRAMDFSVNVFSPTDYNMQEEVRKRIDKNLMADDETIMLPAEIERVVGANDQDAANVLKKHHARKPLREMWDIHGHFSHEEFEGLVISVEGGRVDLAAVAHAE